MQFTASEIVSIVAGIGGAVVAIERATAARGHANVANIAQRWATTMADDIIHRDLTKTDEPHYLHVEDGPPVKAD